MSLWPRESALRLRKPSSRNLLATELLPLAIPPVRPSFNIDRTDLKIGHTPDRARRHHRAAFAEVLARRRRAALTVLLISMVMVMGPTPPGTGVSAPAVLMASG